MYCTNLTVGVLVTKEQTQIFHNGPEDWKIPYVLFCYFLGLQIIHLTSS